MMPCAAAEAAQTKLATKVAAMADRVIAAEIRHDLARFEVRAQAHRRVAHLERGEDVLLHDRMIDDLNL